MGWGIKTNSFLRRVARDKEANGGEITSILEGAVLKGSFRKHNHKDYSSEKVLNMRMGARK